jgi:cysteine-rich repeat protein
VSNLLFVSQCDDGNNTDGDGCTASCQIEDSYLCLKQSQVDSYLNLNSFDPNDFSPEFQKVGVDLPIDKDICYPIGKFNSEQPIISIVRITQLDFLFISSADLQFPVFNKYFRGSPPTVNDPFLLDFMDIQLAIFNLELHSSSNIFSSLYSDLQSIQSSSSSSSSSSSPFYVNPVTNQLLSDFSLILDTFSTTKSDVQYSSIDFTDSSGSNKQQVTILISFSILSIKIIHTLPDFRFIDVQIIPNQEVRSFDAKLEIYFKNVDPSAPSSPLYF